MIGPAWVGIWACWDVEDQMAYGVLAFLLLAPIGTFLLIRAAIWRRMERLDALARACSLTQPWRKLQPPHAGGAGSQLAVAGADRGKSRPPTAPRARSLSVAGYRYPKPNPASRPSFAKMSWLGLIVLLCYIVIAIPVWVTAWTNQVIPRGLKIRILRPGVQAPVVSGIQPLLVRLVCDKGACGRGREPNLFVNSQPVAWEDFDAVLRKELSRRPPSWPVYVQGDPNLEWAWVLKVVDMVRGLPAEVVLVTRSP